MWRTDSDLMTTAIVSLCTIIEERTCSSIDSFLYVASAITQELNFLIFLSSCFDRFILHEDLVCLLSACIDGHVLPELNYSIPQLNQGSHTNT